MSLGKNILSLRKKSGLSQEQLGEKVDVTRQTISNWENESTVPNPEQLKLLARTFHVSVDELIENDLTNVVLSKVRVTEAQTNSIKRVAKWILGVVIILVIIDIITFIICFAGKFGPFEEKKSNVEVSYNVQEEQFYGMNGIEGSDNYEY